MDWLRRNWPDLLIGLALVAVIAGIIATLISGGSFFPAGNRTAENPGQGTTPLTGPASAGNQPNQMNSGDVASGAGLDAVEVDGADITAAAAADDTVAADGSAAGVGSSSSLTVTPDASGNDAVADATASADGAAGNAAGDAAAAADQSSAALPVAVLPSGGQASDSAAVAGAGAAQESAPASSVSSTPVAAGDAGADSGIDIPASASSEAPYRVSVGAYANRANAEGQAATFRAAGYPVFIGEQGDLNIVLVGPYDSESQARSVAAGIRNGDFGVADPTVYEFTGDDEQAAAQAPASSVSSSAAGPASSLPSSQSSSQAGAEAVITSSPAAADGVRYLQAGAYGSRDSSLPQRDRLEGLGFVVTERVENDLVKLLIGPFDAANLENAESRLEAAGIASFPR